MIRPEQVDKLRALWDQHFSGCAPSPYEFYIKTQLLTDRRVARRLARKSHGALHFEVASTSKRGRVYRFPAVGADNPVIRVFP